MIETLPPLLSAGVRFAAAGLIMLSAIRVHGAMSRRERGTERPSLIQWRSAAIVGTLLLLGGNGGVVLAELRIPSGVAAVLVATVPIWLAVFDALVTRRRPSHLVIGGLVAGIVGVAVLLAPLEGFGDVDPLGVLLVVGAAMLWALGSLYARHAPLPRSGLLVTGMEMVSGGTALVLAGLLLGELGRADFGDVSLRSVIAFGYLVVFGSLVAFTAYTWLLANTSVAVVGTYAYVNPVVAVALGALLLAEPITARTVVASIIVIGAVVAMVTGRHREQDEPPEAGELDATTTPEVHRSARGETA